MRTSVVCLFSITLLLLGCGKPSHVWELPEEGYLSSFEINNFLNYPVNHQHQDSSLFRIQVVELEKSDEMWNIDTSFCTDYYSHDNERLAGIYFYKSGIKPWLFGMQNRFLLYANIIGPTLPLKHGLRIGAKTESILKAFGKPDFQSDQTFVYKFGADATLKTMTVMFKNKRIKAIEIMTDSYRGLENKAKE